MKLSHLFTIRTYHYPNGFDTANVEIKLYQRCFKLASRSDSEVVSTLCNLENPTSDFA